MMQAAAVVASSTLSPASRASAMSVATSVRISVD